MFKWNSMYFSLCLFLLFLSLGSAEKNLDPPSLFASNIYTHQYTFICIDSPLKPLFSRLENPSSASPGMSDAPIL